MTAGTETIVVKVPTGEPDRHGQASYGTPFDIERCVVAPRTTAELEEGGAVMEGYMVLAPPVPEAYQITPDSRVTVRGRDWDVDGVPGDYRKKNGRKKGVLLTLKRVGS